MTADSAALPAQAQLAQPSIARARPSDFHIPTLDGLRAVAFLLVFFAHTGLGNLIPGGFGVTVFFFLSGYLITTLLRLEARSTGTISLRNFYIRRCFRILPPIYLTLAFACLLAAIGFLPGAGNLFGVASALAYFYNYAELLHLHAILPSGLQLIWSLTIEEHFYFVFPLLYVFLIRRSVLPANQARLLFSLCCLALLWRLCVVFFLQTTLPANGRGWTYSSTDCRFDAILFGCILAIRNNPWCQDPSPWLRRHKGLFALGGLLLLLATGLVRDPHFRLTLRYSLQSLALYPIFYFCIAAADTWPCRWLDFTPLRWLGWLSYTMYLSHMALLEAGDAHFPAHHTAVVIAAFALSLLYAWLMRLFVEQPSRRLRAHFDHASPILSR